MTNPAVTPETSILLADLVAPTDEDNAETARQASWLVAAINTVEPA